MKERTDGVMDKTISPFEIAKLLASRSTHVFQRLQDALKMKYLPGLVHVKWLSYLRDLV